MRPSVQLQVTTNNTSGVPNAATAQPWFSLVSRDYTQLSGIMSNSTPYVALENYIGVKTNNPLRGKHWKIMPKAMTVFAGYDFATSTVGIVGAKATKVPWITDSDDDVEQFGLLVCLPPYRATPDSAFQWDVFYKAQLLAKNFIV